MMNHVNLALVETDSRRRATISHLLSGTGAYVEPFENLRELASCLPRRGVVLVHDEGSIIREVIERMTEAGNWLPVIAYAESPTISQVVQAMSAGAIDYLGWPFSADEIKQALLVAEQNSESMGSARVREAMARSRIQKLTKREREVLTGVASGLSSRMIGERLAISPRTIEIHRANMLKKMGANHTSEAIRIAIEASLVT